MYGKGMQLVLPNPSFVAKTANSQSGQKIFINVCTSEKVCFGNQPCLMLLFHSCIVACTFTLDNTLDRKEAMLFACVLCRNSTLCIQTTDIAGSACMLTCAFVITMKENVSAGTELYSMPVVDVTYASLHGYSFTEVSQSLTLQPNPAARNTIWAQCMHSTSCLLVHCSTIAIGHLQ